MSDLIARALVILLVGLATSAGQERALSVCDLFENLASYVGKLVTVTGTYSSGPHGAILVGKRCKNRFVTDGYACPTSLSIELHNTITRYAGESRPAFELDYEAWRKFTQDRALTNAHLVTCTGELRLKKEYTSHGVAEGPGRSYPVTLYNGYGPSES